MPLTPITTAAWPTLVAAEAAGDATIAESALLAADAPRWIRTLQLDLDAVDDALDAADRLVDPDERRQIRADLYADLDRLEDAYDRALAAAGLAPEPRPEAAVGPPVAAPVAPVPAEPARLQASWAAGFVVLWAAGRGTAPLHSGAVEAMAADAGAGSVGWLRRKPINLPGGLRADALAAPADHTIGWLAAVASGQEGGDLVAPSARWLGEVTAWAVELVAEGRAVPVLRRTSEHGVARCRIRWAPALVDREKLKELAARRPGAAAVDLREDPEATTRAVLVAVVDTLFREAASRVPSLDTPPRVETAAEVGEAFLAGLTGDPFEAGEKVAALVGHRIERWARAVTADAPIRLIVRLAEPDDAGAWILSVHAPDREGGEVPVEVALGTFPGDVRQSVAGGYERLERLIPALTRPGRARRGEVALSAGEAWDLMAEVGPTLSAAGFAVQLPRLSKRRQTPALRLETESRGPSIVGAAQLAKVRWSVVFGDLELTADDLARLVAQATPLVRSGGRWVELDRGDLVDAAAALAERAAATEMSGAEVLRHALGLEGATLAGGVRVEGDGWAADLLRRAGTFPPKPVDAPVGFRGTLRAYQAEALGWLGFLDESGLGGCLALDMGLGKTATVLARLAQPRDGDGPTLGVVPQAVLGNWAAEARKFAPGLRVAIHHGASRTNDVAALAGRVDIVLTTFGTMVRDVDALARISWDRIVVDEAQAIKNPTSETARCLRRVPARSRIALTGTPVENGLGDLWAILDFANPGLVGPRNAFIAALAHTGGQGGAQGAETALRALNGLLVFRRTKAEPEIAAELPDKIDELESCAMTPEQIGLYQAVLDQLVAEPELGDTAKRQGAVLAAITKLKQICDHPAAYTHDDKPLTGRSGKLARLEQIVDAVAAADEKLLVFTHFARWGERLAGHLTERGGRPVACYHGGLTRTARDQMVQRFQDTKGAAVLVLSLQAGGTGLNLTAANHVVLFDRWWNPAVEDQARDRAWRIGQNKTVISRRFVCPGTVDERVEEVVEGKRKIADLVLPKSSSLGDLTADQLRTALGLRPDELVEDEGETGSSGDEPAERRAQDVA